MQPDRYALLPHQRSDWDIVCSALHGPILSISELHDAMRTYLERNTDLQLTTLESCLMDTYGSGQTAWFRTRLPSIIEFALDIHTLFPEGIPLLEGGSERSVTLNQHQIVSILANGFLCTYPTRGGLEGSSFRFSYMNFLPLFAQCMPVTKSKLRCILHYFEVMSNRKQLELLPGNSVLFERRAGNLCNEFPFPARCLR